MASPDDQAQPERLAVATTDPALAERARFIQLFPGIADDGVLDVGKLAARLGLPVTGLEVNNGSVEPAVDDRFGLSWAGRERAVESLRAPSMAALAPDPEHSIGWDTAQNVFIEGDNLEALKLLQHAYNDGIDLIYIDPPYNTGNDFVYNDDFADPVRRYLEVTGQIDAAGNRLTSNTDQSGRKHSNWITMMYPRLMLARNLLSQAGAIFVSIDDNEVTNLRLIMDEIFGPENFIAQMVWAAGRKNDSKWVSESHEYIVVYCRNNAVLREQIGEWRSRKEGLDDIYAQYDRLRRAHGDDHAKVQEGLRAWFRSLSDDQPAKRHAHYKCVDHRGIYFPDNISWPGSGDLRYDVLHPRTGKKCRVPASGWRFTEQRMAELLSEDLVHFGDDETTVPCIKRHLREHEHEAPYSVFYQDGRGATKRLREFLGGSWFDNPKDETVLQRIVEFASRPDSTVLDFFAGSGTTGHAVMLQNQKDGGSRRYILVNIPEPTNEKSEARKAGFETVSEITRLRLRKVAESVPVAKEMGLRCYRIGPSAFLTASSEVKEGELPLLLESTLRPDASDDEIAAEILLKSGVRLDASWRRTTFGAAPTVVSGPVAAVVSREVDHADADAVLGDAEVHTAVFLEDAFSGRDPVKTDAFFAFRQAGKTLKTV